MKKSISLILFAFFAISLFGQSSGSWGICEFSTVVAMDAYDPSTSTFHCKKVYVQATDQHYKWDGSAWVLENSGGENLYNTNDTLTADRTLEGNANSFFIVGLDSLYMEGTQIELNASGNLTFFGTGTMEFELDATDGKGLYMDANGQIGIGTSAPAAQLEVAGGTVRFSDYGAGTYADTTGAYILGVEADGDLVEMNVAKNARVFFSPSFAIEASSTDTGLTVDLYDAYYDQFANPMVISSGAPGQVPFYSASELYYYVTYYDNTVMANLSIDANGVLTYDIIAVPSDNYSQINVVFVIK